MRHITRCLNPKLTDICQRAIKLEALSEIVHDMLPEALRNQCHVGSFRSGTLNLVTHDPVWASQLRYIVPELRDKLRRDAAIYQLASIKITIDTIQTASRLNQTSVDAPLLKPKKTTNPFLKDALAQLLK